MREYPSLASHFQMTLESKDFSGEPWAPAAFTGTAGWGGVGIGEDAGRQGPLTPLLFGGMAYLAVLGRLYAVLEMKS